jgi:1-acyl-sn-glycerol-3-phosphate acyltransferase
MNSPRYTYSLRLIIPLLRVLLGIRSSLSRDGALLLAGASPPPRVLHPENIPPASPFILTINHYDRPGLGAWWGAAVLVTAIAARRTRAPREIHFAMAREWWYPRGWRKWIEQPLTRWFFGQISKTYGTILLPPALDLAEFRGTGAGAIRRALALTRGENPALVGIAPEGHTGAGLALCAPPRGTGLFLLHLTRERIPILPAGIFEDDAGVLTVNFGAPFHLRVPRDLPREERDVRAARQVMCAIGALLPERMWGVYREEISFTRTNSNNPPRLRS